MFFLQELEKTIQLHPSFFGPRVKEYLTNRLYEQVEGTCNGYYYVICVVDAFDISEGRVVPGLANAEYVIRYRAVVWKPFKGEVLDAMVTSVNPLGIFADVGPIQAFISSNFVPADVKWDPSATPPQFTNNSDQVYEKGTHLRLKVIGTRSDVERMFIVTSIKEDYLGSLT